VITPRGATLTKILERAWDKGEDYGGDTALSKANRSLFEEIDKAMDQFINLLLAHPSAAPDQARLKAAYSTYLEKLKRADWFAVRFTLSVVCEGLPLLPLYLVARPVAERLRNASL
jgi:hypothetical protein